MTENKKNETQLFIAIVDNRDGDLFQTLVNSQNKYKLVWGFRAKDRQNWKKINRGDIICMALESSDMFGVFVRVKNTIMDFKCAKKWGSDFRTLQMTHMAYFSDIQKIQIPRSALTKYISENTNVPGIYQVQKDVNSIVERWQLSVKETKSILPIDIGGPPGKIKYKIVRYIRDTQKSRKLKELYDDYCQVCHYRLYIGHGQYYSEVHHIRPLSEGGDDDFSNMIVLCPTHHAEFDYGAICINENQTCVLDINSDKTKKITIKPKHKIALKNIKYNLNRVKM